MSVVVLVRHGQASFGAEDYDVLSPLGWEQADWLGGYMKAHGLRFDRVWSGTLRRHRETAQGLLAHDVGPAPQEDARFNELDYDLLERDYIRLNGPMTVANRNDFLRSFPRVFGGWADGDLGEAGESFAAFEARVNAALDDALEPGKHVLIVTSGGVIGMVLRRILGLDPRTTADLILNIHNASVHQLAHEDGRLRLALFNASPHFDPSDRSHARTYI